MALTLRIQRFFLLLSSGIAVLALVASVFMFVKEKERDAYIASFIHVSLDKTRCATRDDTVLTLSQSIFAMTNDIHGVEPDKMDWYDRFESTFIFNMSSSVALKYGAYGVRGHYVFGPCGTMSRLLLNTLWELDIPARKLQLLNNEHGIGGGHTLVEYFDQGKWKVIAPSDSAFVWRNEKGEIASTSEIRKSNAVLAQIYTFKPDYPYRFDNPNHLNWTKVPRWFQGALRSILGSENVDNIETPRLYDHPRLCLMLMCVSIMLIASFSALKLHMRTRRAMRLYKRRLYRISLRSAYLQAAPLIRSGASPLNTKRVLNTK